MNGPPASLDVVIVTYNSRAEIGACLDSLRRWPPACPCRVFVVDNASTDDTVRWLETNATEVTRLANRENVGFARACNMGIRAGHGEAVLLLNPDTRVGDGSLDALLAALAGGPDVAAAGPRLVDASGRVEISWGAMIGPLAELRQKVLGTLYAKGWPGVGRSIARQSHRLRPVDWVSGACLLVRRREAEAVGLLDERFFLYTEDVDLCAALRARGRQVLYVPNAEVVHLRGRSRATRADAANTAYRRSQLAFYEKHHPRWAPWLRRYLRWKGALKSRDLVLS